MIQCINAIWLMRSLEFYSQSKCDHLDFFEEHLFDLFRYGQMFTAYQKCQRYGSSIRCGKNIVWVSLTLIVSLFLFISLVWCARDACDERAIEWVSHRWFFEYSHKMTNASQKWQNWKRSFHIWMNYILSVKSYSLSLSFSLPLFFCVLCDCAVASSLSRTRGKISRFVTQNNKKIKTFAGI